MKDILSNGKKFINCDFTNSKLRKCNFYNCYFENCIFDGVDFSFSNISGSTFVKSRPSEYKLKSCSVYDNLKFI
ncbi:TPA: pentapeptide repeat-containing protein [Morganella morganii]